MKARYLDKALPRPSGRQCVLNNLVSQTGNRDEFEKRYGHQRCGRVERCPLDDDRGSGDETERGQIDAALNDLAGAAVTVGGVGGLPAEQGLGGDRGGLAEL